MSNAFMQLHDFALSSGLLDKIPDFGSQLRATTEKFLTLAREASDGGPKDGEPGDSPRSNPTDSATHSEHPGSDLSGRASGQVTTVASPDEEPKVQPYGGFSVTHEPVSQADLGLLYPTPAPTSGYEVVAYPTLDNASFPFQTTPGFDIMEEISAASPYLGLPTPNSYARLESTFGRQVQRYALERALILISMANPPEIIISKVFGFCLLLESRDAIKRRLSRSLGHNAQQNLSYWEFPFFHLGGAGTHLDATNIPPNQRIGNQGTFDVDKPTQTSGFAMGPFSAGVNGVRDRELDKDMRIALPAFAGEYFDCDEAEMYLYQRGVVIPPGANFVTADVDPRQFGDAEWPVGEAGEPDYVSLGASLQGQGTSSSSASPPPSMVGGAALTDVSAPEVSVGSWAMPEATGLVDPTIMDGFSQPSSSAYLTSTIPAPSSSAYLATPIPAPASSAATLTPSPAAANLPPFANFVPNNGGSGFGTAPMPQDTARQRVVVDVDILIRGQYHLFHCVSLTVMCSAC
jgi:hypothetical protein